MRCTSVSRVIPGRARSPASCALAVGGVYNNGASYVATGAFNASYNLGSLSGNMTISNLDGNTFGGPISVISSSNQYLASLTGGGPHGNLVGAADGFYFGPGGIDDRGPFCRRLNRRPLSNYRRLQRCPPLGCEFAARLSSRGAWDQGPKESPAVGRSKARRWSVERQAISKGAKSGIGEGAAKPSGGATYAASS